MSWWEVPVYEVAVDYFDVYGHTEVHAPPVTRITPIFIISENAAGLNWVEIVAPTYDYGVVSVVPTNEAARDTGHIIIQSITQDYFQLNIKKFLPYEFWRMDAMNIAEGGGDGAMEDLVDVFAISLDEIKQAIDEFTELFDIDHCPPRYLRVIAEMLNYPLEATDTTAEQRRQLKEAVNWYRTKGARRGFIAMLYAFGFYAEVIPLWTENTPENPYAVFTETIPGVAPGNDPPNDYPQLVENGGTWFRSPHFGIRLLGVVGDRHVQLNWNGLTENQIPIVNDIVDTTPDNVETSFAGQTFYAPIIAGSVSGTTWTSDSPPGTTVTFSDTATPGVLAGTGVTGTIDYDTGAWTLEFDTAPTAQAEIKMDYEFDFEPVRTQYGLHGAVYRYWDELNNAGALLQYFFDEDAFSYLWRRLEFMRPVFAVLDWLELLFQMQEKYEVPDVEVPYMIAMPVRDESGWYYGYCDQDDAVYTRRDARLLGADLDIDQEALTGVAPPGVVTITDEVHAVSATASIYEGTLVHSWIFTGVTFTAVVGGSPIDAVGNGEGYVTSVDETVTGTIDYLTGAFQLIFVTPPDNPSNILVDYTYVDDIPPVDRSGAMPRGSTELPFPHVRDPQPGVCHPPEELLVFWYWIDPEQYTLPLTRDGLVYLPAGPVPYIDHSDFPSRGFTDGGGNPGHANTLTREFGYAERPLSLLRVQANPDADAENWENQSTSWENWTGPWENIGD